MAAATAFEIYDVAWTLRDGISTLLIASTKGLYELVIGGRHSLQQLVVGDLPADLGFWSVAIIHDVRGQPITVAVAAEELRGVWLSHEGGRSKTFVPSDLKEDVRAMAVQQAGSRAFFWAGCAVAGNVPGRGCFRWGGLHEGWEQFPHGWRGGSCYGLAIAGTSVLAATYDAGVLRLDTERKDSVWETPASDCGLPKRDEQHPFAAVTALAADPAGQTVLAGGKTGVFRSLDQGTTYESVSRSEFTDRVSLPEGALFCSADHELTIVGEDEPSE
jgi:hypothetical protein